MVLHEYTYVFVIGTFFALLDAYNNGANDVANAWATSVSSRSITYRWAMVLGTFFEMLGALTVGARTADTIKNGIIPNTAFQGNAGVQMLAFTCALAAAASWVMWCTRHSTHVSSTYSLISGVAGVGVAVAGASKVQWGWNGGKGLGAIFAGLAMAPAASACFGAIIFLLIKFCVHKRGEKSVYWAVWTSPFFFLIAGVICTLSIVYKGSPRLGLNKKPAWFVAAITMAGGGGLFVFACLFFVPYIHSRVIKGDSSVTLLSMWRGPTLFNRPVPDGAVPAAIPKYAVVQDEATDCDSAETPFESKGDAEASVAYGIREIRSERDVKAEGQARLHAKLREQDTMLGKAMLYLHEHPMGPGQIYERRNMVTLLKRIPSMIVVGALYGLNYDIHAAQTGISGTPDGDRMERVYASAEKYPDNVEHTYSFVQIITACTASFAHGANDIGNAVGPWAAIYTAWRTGSPAASKNPVDLWQLAVISTVLSLGLVTYGYNIMKVMGNKITYHSPSRGCSMEMGAAITILIFSQYALPVSTSMCITGATVGVGLCNGTFRAVNWQRVGLLAFSWIMTIPIVGLLAGCTMGIILNAPHFS